MLRQSGCAAFSGAVVDPVVEAARSCGLRGLSKILGTAQPTVWWRDACAAGPGSFASRAGTARCGISMRSGATAWAATVELLNQSSNGRTGSFEYGFKWF